MTWYLQAAGLIFSFTDILLDLVGTQRVAAVLADLPPPPPEPENVKARGLERTLINELLRESTAKGQVEDAILV